MTTQERVYMDAQDACGLKIGDYVKVKYALPDGDGWSSEKKPCWCGYAMDDAVGNIFEIKDMGYQGIRLSDGYNYPYFVLEKVEKPQHKFKPFEKVLVRNSKKGNWRCDIYSHRDNAGIHHCAGNGNWWQYCIPYEGNEHLVGTAHNPV